MRKGRRTKICEGCNDSDIRGVARDEWFDRPTLCERCYAILLERPVQPVRDDEVAETATESVPRFVVVLVDERTGIAIGDDIAQHRQLKLYGGDGNVEKLLSEYERMTDG